MPKNTKEIGATRTRRIALHAPMPKQRPGSNMREVVETMTESGWIITEWL